jgi:ureidoacrylate peracid hydrolase
VSPFGLVGNSRTGWIVRDGTADLTRKRRSGRSVEIAARPERVIFDTARTALVVVDMQNDFCAPGGWLAHIGVDVAPLGEVIEPISQLAEVLRRSEVPIIFLNWGNRPDRANLPSSILHVYDADGSGVGIGDALPNGAAVLERGSWSTELVEGLEAEEGDIFIDKYRMTGFVDTEMDSVLRNLDVTTLLFAGVNLDQCVYATLMDAAALGYDCVLLEDCCATTSPPECATGTLYNVAQCFGFVASASAVRAGLSAGGSERAAFERYSPTPASAHRISAGDSVKLIVLRRPNETYDASIFLEVWDPGGAQPPNSHPNSVETFYFLRGSGTAHSDGKETEVTANDLIVLPPGTLHRIENTGDDKLYAITTMTPDGGFADLVEAGPAAALDDEDLALLRASSVRPG